MKNRGMRIQEDTGSDIDLSSKNLGRGTPSNAQLFDSDASSSNDTSKNLGFQTITFTSFRKRFKKLFANDEEQSEGKDQQSEAIGKQRYLQSTFFSSLWSKLMDTNEWAGLAYSLLTFSLSFMYKLASFWLTCVYWSTIGVWVELFKFFYIKPAIFAFKMARYVFNQNSHRIYAFLYFARDKLEFYARPLLIKLNDYAQKYAPVEKKESKEESPIEVSLTATTVTWPSEQGLSAEKKEEKIPKKKKQAESKKEQKQPVQKQSISPKQEKQAELPANVKSEASVLLSDLIKQVNELNTSKDLMSREFQDFRRDHHKLENRMADKERELQYKTKAIENLERQIKNSNTREQELRKQFNDFKAKCEKEHTKRSNLLDQSERSHQNIEQHNKLINDLKHKLASRDEEFHSLSNQVQQLKDTIEQRDGAIHKLQQKKKEFKQFKKDLNRRLLDLERDLSNTEQERDVLRKKFLNTYAHQLESQLSVFQKESAAKIEELQKERDRIIDVNSQVNQRFKKEIEKLKAQSALQRQEPALNEVSSG